MEKILEPEDKKKGKKKKNSKKCNKKCRKRKICKKKRKKKGSNKRKGCWKKRKSKKKKKKKKSNKNQKEKEKKKKGRKIKVKRRRGLKKKKNNMFRSRSVIQPMSKNMFRSRSVKIPRKEANKKPEMLHETNENTKNSSFPLALDQPKDLTSFQTDFFNKSNDLPEVKIKSDKRGNDSKRNKIIPQLLFSHIIKLHNILRDHANNSSLHNHEPEEIISSGADLLNEAKVVAKMKEKDGYDWKHIQRR